MKYDTDNNRRESYSRYRDQSLHGDAVRREHKKKKVSYNQYRASLAAVCVATTIAVSGLIGIGNHVHQSISDTMVLNQMLGDFQANVINPETHRTNDNQNYFYDYGDIARRMEEMDDFDVALYLLDSNLGDNQSARVLSHTSVNNWDNYLSSHNYQDSQEFREAMRERVLLESEISNKQEELRKMTQEHESTQQDDDTLTFGGNK